MIYIKILIYQVSVLHCHYVLLSQYPQLYYSVLAELELKTDAFFTIFSRIICSSNVLQLEIISVTYGKNKSGSGHYGSFHKFGLQPTFGFPKLLV